MSKYRVSSGPYFPIFSPNTGKCEPGKNSAFWHFSRSDWLKLYNKMDLSIRLRIIYNVKHRHETIGTWILAELTAWKVSKYRVSSGPYFPIFSPNTGKCEPGKNSAFWHFSRSDWLKLYNKMDLSIRLRIIYNVKQRHENLLNFTYMFLTSLMKLALEANASVLSTIKKFFICIVVNFWHFLLSSQFK